MQKYLKLSEQHVGHCCLFAYFIEILIIKVSKYFSSPKFPFNIVEFFWFICCPLLQFRGKVQLEWTYSAGRWLAIGFNAMTFESTLILLEHECVLLNLTQIYLSWLLPQHKYFGFSGAIPRRRDANHLLWTLLGEEETSTSYVHLVEYTIIRGEYLFLFNIYFNFESAIDENSTLNIEVNCLKLKHTFIFQMKSFCNILF